MDKDQIIKDQHKMIMELREEMKVIREENRLLREEVAQMKRTNKYKIQLSCRYNVIDPYQYRHLGM